MQLQVFSKAFYTMAGEGSGVSSMMEYRKKCSLLFLLCVVRCVSHGFSRLQAWGERMKEVGVGI